MILFKVTESMFFGHIFRIIYFWCGRIPPEGISVKGRIGRGMLTTVPGHSLKHLRNLIQNIETCVFNRPAPCQFEFFSLWGQKKNWEKFGMGFLVVYALCRYCIFCNVLVSFSHTVYIALLHKNVRQGRRQLNI
jgi:hypothetical protein